MNTLSSTSTIHVSIPHSTSIQNCDTYNTYNSAGMESHHLVERYGTSLASLQSQLASMEAKQIAYENLTNKKLFDLASRIGFHSIHIHL